MDLSNIQSWVMAGGASGITFLAVKFGLPLIQSARGIHHELDQSMNDLITMQGKKIQLQSDKIQALESEIVDLKTMITEMRNQAERDVSELKNLLRAEIVKNQVVNQRRSNRRAPASNGVSPE